MFRACGIVVCTDWMKSMTSAKYDRSALSLMSSRYVCLSENIFLDAQAPTDHNSKIETRCKEISTTNFIISYRKGMANFLHLE